MYKIGELSKLSNLPVKTLRYYDSEGLLSPDYIDDFTGYRYYSAAKLSDCYRIITLKELGFSLAEIRELFSLPNDKFSSFLTNKELELEEQKKRTENRINILRNLTSALKENTPMYDIVIKNNDEIRLLYYRSILSDKSECEQLLTELRTAIPSKNLGQRMVLIDYETEYVNNNFDIGLGIEITGDFRHPDRYSEKTIHFSTDTANLICKDADCADAVQALHKYALDNGYQIVGPTYKIVYPDDTIEIKLPVVKLQETEIVCKDDIRLPFENDAEVIGHWELFDLLPCKEMFHPQKQKTVLTDEHIKELYFLPNGEKYWCFSWTKGLLLSVMGYKHSTCQNRYTVETINNQTFLFVEFKGKEFSYGGQPELWVFRKTDEKEYRKQDIGIKDEIPNLPSNDTAVLGKWEACSFVKRIEDFQPGTECSIIPQKGLFWRSAEFLNEGALLNSFKNSTDDIIATDAPHIWCWVNGYVICNTRPTASKYVIKEINGTKYLFIQWKSGDYYFGRREPSWYVFKR